MKWIYPYISYSYLWDDKIWQNLYQELVHKEFDLNESDTSY